MERSNVRYLKERFELTLGAFLNRDTLFIVEIDLTDKPNASSGIMSALYVRLLRLTEGKKLGLDEICDRLVTSRNEMPLWIKIVEVEKNQFKLLISRRFRKKSVVDEWHGDNELKPIIKELDNFV